MAHPNDVISEREKYVNGWNETMIKIWTEQIQKLGVVDTGRLLSSPLALPVRADGRFVDLTLSQSFLEYGLWQDLGVGREVPIGNPGDIDRDKVRERRRWFSTKYWSSVLNLRDFLGTSLGREFTSFLTNLDAADIRKQTAHYRRRGLS